MSKKKPKILELNLDRPLVETSSSAFPVGQLGEGEILFYDVVTALRRAREDPRVDGFLLKLRPMDIGWAMLAELSRSIGDFRASGKRTMAYLESGGNREMALAAGCERLILHPGALLTVASPGLEALFLKDALAEMGVEADLAAVGKYKGAGERLTRRDMSEPNREQLRALVSGLRKELVRMIASGRTVAEERVEAWLDEGPYSALQALEAGLVDELAEDVDVQKRFERSAGQKLRIVSYRQFARKPGLVRRLLRRRRAQVAVLYACGFITDGKGRSFSRSMAGVKELAAQLDRARASKRVKAIVLRVDSSGGDAVSSDRLRHSILRAKEEKPVIVSMGDTAASGGYLIATAASQIYAEGTTLTGSIGVVGGKIVIRRLLDRMGIHRDSVTTGDNASMFSALRRFKPKEKAWYQEWMVEFYRERFLPAVATARNMDLENADSLAQGRVWLGRDAKANGLVDELGGLQDAIDAACRTANLERGRTNVVRLVQRRSLLKLFQQGALTRASMFAGKQAQLDSLMQCVDLSELGEVAEWFRVLRPHSLLAVMPFRIRIR